MTAAPNDRDGSNTDGELFSFCAYFLRNGYNKTVIGHKPKSFIKYVTLRKNKIEKAAILTDLSFQIRRMAAQAMTLASSILRRFVSMDGCVYI